MLRVVAGRYRGRRLWTPPGDSTRPTADRMKETLFDILQWEVDGSRFLDLFAGTGSIGIEALSRGAREVVCVERAAPVLGVLRRNVEQLSAQEHIRIVRGDAIRYLSTPQAVRFDLVFADPPYGAGLEDALVAALRPESVRSGGWFVLQHHATWRPGAPLHGYELARTKTFGATQLDFFQRLEAHEISRSVG